MALSTVFADAAKDKGEYVKTLGKDDKDQFVLMTVQRSARFEEMAVFQRVTKEKAAELKDVLAQLEGEQGMDPKLLTSIRSLRP